MRVCTGASPKQVIVETFLSNCREGGKAFGPGPNGPAARRGGRAYCGVSMSKIRLHLDRGMHTA